MAGKSNINDKLKNLTKEQATALSGKLNAGYDGKKSAKKSAPKTGKK